MNILYFGTVCDLESYNTFLDDCKEKPSVASIVFETSILKGLYKNNAQVEIHSFPMVPSFPHSKHILFGGKSERLSCGYTCRWLKTVNIPVLKQLSRRWDAKKRIIRWARKYGSQGVLFTYSIPPFLVADVLKYSKKIGYKTVAIVPDLLKDMYINEKTDSIISKVKNMYVSRAVCLQDQYDGYIYLTEAMCQAVAPNKPYVIIEAIADVEKVRLPRLSEKTEIPSIMYAGMLHEKYGINNLLNAFEMLDIDNAELWLFGQGTAVNEVKRRAKLNPQIKYFGTVSRSQILEFERKATCLINPRSADEEFTEYSFPSKTIEYMLSGTPVLTTRLKGIPAEYFNYVYTADNNTPEELKSLIESVLSASTNELINFGAKAQNFIVCEKNAEKQTKKIMKFFNEVVHDTKN